MNKVVITEDTPENAKLYWMLTDNGWEYYLRGAYFEGYIKDMRLVANSKYANEFEKRFAQNELTEIEAYLKNLKSRDFQRANKAKMCKRRRNEFGRKRNGYALALINRDGFVCLQCGSQDDLTIDHIVPISKGGTDDLSNLQFLCRTCNSRKSDK